MPVIAFDDDSSSKVVRMDSPACPQCGPLDSPAKRRAHPVAEASRPKEQP